ncbi:DUF1064 domain-containing protein [Fructilactobacillus lindneri]|uniref:DUF1064 domain-containing protein n=1 Tax=Fructilactobacillus lindneri TaxID=53444 RepID=UPI0009C80196|nr:DUF1064 domain-containing protein [Fructilactobacillus lindneri]POH05340.1 hypothetical protein BGL35_06130 [Fructilactobacillus lindneri]POH05922.1 hypothetical protein BGL36_05760 [Fructilactobacillus lindneri]POH22829.1 hypothetical protein BHU33_06130 [Fructilactobacillus lindneri DSM 20690 = JCM 11027]SKA07956.1 Protein of unknown function [Fructilactobacillus lindneri DSM 20690 = JCM 11027]
MRLKKSRKSKGNKYGAKKQIIDGIKFDSKAEAQYYLIYVKNNWKHFSVHESFEITPKFKLDKRNKRHRVYSPDFVKRDENGKILKVVDVKPEKITDGASLRMNQFEFIYKIPKEIRCALNRFT